MNKLKHILLFLLMLGLGVAQAWAQSTITGTVKDTDGEMLIGATVAIKGTQKGTQTDVDGKFSLEIPVGATNILVSYAGHVTQDIEIGNRSTIDVVLSLTETEEVVVVGYGSQLKKNFVGAAAIVDAEAMEKLPVLTINQAMQGQAAGVQVISSSGMPGGGISVRVRGQTSLSAGNNPLYIIDGVPMVNGSLGQVGFGGQNTSSLAGLNPDDIESMQVLKDASATAIYGARAANGVIVITTKRGKAGKPVISFTMNRSWGKETNRITMLNSSQYRNLINEAKENDGVSITPIDTTINTDWLNEVFRVADIADYQANISGGEGKTRYFASFSHRDEKAIIIGSQFNRYTFRANVTNEASSRISFGTNIAASYDLNNRVNGDNNIYGVLSTAILCPPNVPVYTKDGEYGTWQFANPVATALEPRYANTNLKFTGSAWFKYKLLKGKTEGEGLSLRTDASTDYNGYIEDHFEPSTTTQGRPKGYGVYTSRTIIRWVVEPVMTYSKVSDNYNIDAVVGMTLQKTTDQQANATASVFPEDFKNLTYMRSASIKDGAFSTIDFRTLKSYFGRVNYTLKERYTLSLSGRADGSSAFGPNRRYGFFWAAAAGWVISDEAFFEPLRDKINLLKLRTSYGLVGNDQIGNNIWQRAWGVAAYLGNPALTTVRRGNDDLSWESSHKFDIGVEASFYNNRLNVNLGFFNTNTSDLLFAKQLPSTTGFVNQAFNIGKSNNRGLELEVRGTIIDKSAIQKGGFKWDINVNMAYASNKVVSLVDNNPIFSGFSSAILIGQPFNAFYALKSLGVDPETGLMMYEDVNGDGIYSQNDFQYLGSAFAPLYGGITNTFSWKFITLDMFWQLNYGNEIYNNNWEFIQTMGTDAWNQDASVLNRWRQAGDKTSLPRAGYRSAASINNNLSSSRFVMDGSFSRLKNLALSFNVPKNVAQKMKMQSARFTVSGQNIWTITKYKGFDPEVSSFGEDNTSAGTDFLTLPQLQMFTLGVNASF